jgi:Lipopolysaccharide-assembly
MKRLESSKFQAPSTREAPNCKSQARGAARGFWGLVIEGSLELGAWVLGLPLGRALLACFVAAGLSGCAGYTLGPTNGLAAREKSVQIAPFSNQTLEPRLTDAVTAQLRKQLQRDGTYQLATHDNGDLVLSGVITGFQRHEMSFLRNDLVTVRDYRLSLTAQVTARDRVSGKLILDQPVSGYTIIRVGADLTSTERQALPLLAADLAKNVTALLVDGSW